MMDHRHLLLWQKLLKCLRQIALSTLKISLGLPLSPIAQCCFRQYILWLSCCSLLVSRSLAFVFPVLSRYCSSCFCFDRHVGPAFLCPLVFYSLQSVWDMYPLLEMKKKVVPVFLSAKRNGRNTIDCNKGSRPARDLDYISNSGHYILHISSQHFAGVHYGLAITTLRNLFPFRNRTRDR